MRIAGHYLRFALLTAMIGIVIGRVAGAWMGRAMTRLYGDYYRFPDLHYSVTADVYASAEVIDRNLVTMIAFYIAFAGTIVAGVVYNNARILFSERAHELATLRVPGYRRREVATVLAG